MTYQSYQLYQIERRKSAAEIRRADERAGRTAAAVAGMVRRLTAPGRRPWQDRSMDRPLTAVRDRVTTTMEVR